jgi:hypothetical protein
MSVARDRRRPRPSTANPLVAAKAATPVDPLAGVWIAEDIELLCREVRDGSWLDGTLGAESAGLDALAFVADPDRIAAAVRRRVDHRYVKPLAKALDGLAGDPRQISAHAQTWRNVAAALHDRAGDLATAVREDVHQVDRIGGGRLPGLEQ